MATALNQAKALAVSRRRRRWGLKSMLTLVSWRKKSQPRTSKKKKKNGYQGAQQTPQNYNNNQSKQSNGYGEKNIAYTAWQEVELMAITILRSAILVQVAQNVLNVKGMDILKKIVRLRSIVWAYKTGPQAKMEARVIPSIRETRNNQL
jgi:hypothetical protein